MAAWSPNGGELLYFARTRNHGGALYDVDGQFRPGNERVWARVEGNYQDVLQMAPDGRALVIINRQNTQRELRVIVNWQQDIAKKVK